MQTFRDLIFDTTGPAGISRDAWWAFLTTGVIGVVAPTLWRFMWNILERRRWKPIREHFGIMLSWDHGNLGRSLVGFQPGKNRKLNDDPFIKIQNEIGIYAAVIVSDSALGKLVGNYMKSVNDLWWWLDKECGSLEAIPSRLESETYPSLLKKAEESYLRLFKNLPHDGDSYCRSWITHGGLVIGVRGIP